MRAASGNRAALSVLFIVDLDPGLLNRGTRAKSLITISLDHKTVGHAYTLA